MIRKLLISMLSLLTLLSQAHSQGVIYAVQQSTSNFQQKENVPSQHYSSDNFRNFKILLDSVHFQQYTYDNSLQLTHVKSHWNAIQYNFAGEMTHSYYADYPYFTSAKRLSYSFKNSTGFERKVEYNTNPNLGPQGYPSPALINSLLNSIPVNRTHTYRNSSTNRIDSIEEYSFHSLTDSLPTKKETWQYTPADLLKNHTVYKSVTQFGKWFVKKESQYYYDANDRDTLFMEYRERSAGDTSILPYARIRTIYIDNQSYALRYHSVYDTLDHVFIKRQIDSMFFDATGTLSHMIVYDVDFQTQQTQFVSEKRFKLIRFGNRDSLMPYQTLGSDTVFGDNFTYVFNLQDQLVSTVGWSEDPDSNSYYKMTEIKYMYRNDGLLEHVLHYSYPNAYQNVIVLDAHYQFYYSVHETAIKEKEDLQKRTLQVYPNPGNGAVSISADFMIARIEVYDLQGRMVLTCTGENREAQKLNFARFPKGVYLINAYGQDGAIQKVKYLKTN